MNHTATGLSEATRQATEHMTRPGESPEQAYDRRLSAYLQMPGVSMTEYRSVREPLPLGVGLSTTGYQVVRVQSDEGSAVLAFVEATTYETGWTPLAEFVASDQ